MSESGNVRQSRAEKLLKKEAGSLRKPTLLATAIIYALLVGVVIYGAHDHVYDGFGAAAPWVVGGIFALMSVLRLAEYLRSVSDYRLVRGFLDNRRVLDEAEASINEEPEEGQVDYDALDRIIRG